MFDLQCFPEPRPPAHWCATWARTARRWKLGRRRVPPPETEIHVEPSAQARFRRWSNLLRVPGRSRSDVSQGPSCFELERRLIIHRQEGHKAGQQTGIYELLQRRVAFLREQLPETNHITASSTWRHVRTQARPRYWTLNRRSPGRLTAAGLRLSTDGSHIFNYVFNS